MLLTTCPGMVRVLGMSPFAEVMRPWWIGEARWIGKAHSLGRQMKEGAGRHAACVESPPCLLQLLAPGLFAWIAAPSLKWAERPVPGGGVSGEQRPDSCVLQLGDLEAWWPWFGRPKAGQGGGVDK